MMLDESVVRQSVPGSDETGARASFVYSSGFNGFTVVIPAQR